MKRTISTVYLGAVLLINSCDSTTTIKEYYPTGELKTEMEVKNKVRHGLYKEFYENGRPKLVKHYVDGVLDGKEESYDSDGAIAQIFNYSRGKKIGKAEIFYASGKIMEYQYYNNQGHLVDFERFNEDGTRNKQMYAIGFLERDTVNLNEELKYLVKLGNISNTIYSKGELIITSELDDNGNPMDTLGLIPSDTNYYEFVFKATNIGDQEIKGCLQYLIPLDTVNAVLLEQFCFVESYYVQDPDPS